MFFTEAQVVDYPTACSADTGRFRRFFWETLKRGVYMAPSQFECLFPSAVHSDEDVEKTLRVHFEALKAVH
jgi:glutamate-1-semialdehyde 2,1-aminomutase